MDSKNTINILLLGETGVGKSTLINSFPNYFKYKTVKEAVNSDVVCLIPTKFFIPDENLEDRTIIFGSDSNESHKIGESGTVGPRSYIFSTDEQNICFIDTPGIGDSHGVAQDNINFENLFTYISQFKKLDAICILLKPNVTIINKYFQFCIMNLLSRLDKSASQNIVFVFTNTRSTFNRPGETLPLLRKLLKDIEEGPTKVKVPCSKENIFCLDNEAFQFVMALKHNIKFNEREVEEFSLSWENAEQTCMNLLSHIKNNLKPHNLQTMLSINDARRIITDLTKPLTDIAELIQDNIMVLEKRKNEVSQANISVEDLKSKLYVPVLEIIQTKTFHPTIVCNSPRCCQAYTVAGITKYHYNTKCHEFWYLQNLPIDSLGVLGTLGAYAAYLYSTRLQNCNVCRCSFLTHMPIFYETTVEEINYQDETVKARLDSQKDTIAQVNEIIANLEERRNQYNIEMRVISKCMTKFAQFVKNNTLAEYKDVYGDYLDELIKRTTHSPAMVSRYENMKKQYEEEKGYLIHANITPADIFEAANQLYNLPISGEKIRQLFGNQRDGRAGAYRNTMKYF